MTSVRVCSYNIDAARREQTSPHQELHFENRAPRLLQNMREAGADILCLQELRNLDNCTIDVVGMMHYVQRTTGMAAVGPFYYAQDAASFALVTLYARAKFAVENAGIIQLAPAGSTPEHAKICLWTLFQCVSTGRRFIVANTHFDVAPESAKTGAIQACFPQLRDLAAKHQCSVLCVGDYNLFDDLDGKEHRKAIEAFGFGDIFYPLHLDASEQAPVLSGTFKGYSKTDKQAKKFEAMSRLDHGYLHTPANALAHLSPTGKAHSVGATEADIRAESLGSDHLPCIRSLLLQ
jgi:endonuclease/exonuclease/phosphatase family metal-dependent hydrolase